MARPVIDCAVVFCIRNRDGTLTYLASTAVTRIAWNADIAEDPWHIRPYRRYEEVGPHRWSAEGIGLTEWHPGDPMPEPPVAQLPAPRKQITGGRT